jgi:hypothetical protein
VSPLAAFRAYAAHPDPRAAACNTIALSVLSSQPTYPLYVLWLVHGDWQVAWLTLLSSPLFAAVPAVARRNAVAGRAALVLTGLFNTLVSLKAFGIASGVTLFLAPIAMIAGMAFRRSERTTMLVLVGLALAMFAVTQAMTVVPLGRFDAHQYRAFFGLNAWSTGVLVAIVATVFSSALDDVSAGGRSPR